MSEIVFSELINIEELRKMSENLYDISGIPMGVIDASGEVLIAVGWQDICSKFHRANPISCKRCLESDRYIREHINDSRYVSYKCLNNMWDIGVPVVISNQHIATVFLGQFFYEDEVIDEEYFRGQALEFGFDEKEYLIALKKVAVFSREKVEKIIDYFLGLVTTLSESGLRLLENKKIQKELEKNKEYLNSIFNSVNDGIFIHDTYGNITDVNDTVTRMFGYAHDELVNMKLENLISDKSQYSEDDIRNLVLNNTKDSPMIIELIVKDKSNQDFWIEVNINITNIGVDERIITVVRDITKRKLAELALKNETLEMERLRTEFFANISHELRTPLNIILSSIQIIYKMLRNEDKPIDIEKINNYINIERQNCLRLVRLINNLIDSTKLDSREYEVNITKCNIVNIIEDVTMSVAEYIKNNNLKLIFDTDIEEKTMYCDLDKIERIILNLLSNAVKFTNPGGSIFVNILDGEDHIIITVEDTGIGIPKEKLNIIFDRFKQVDKSFTRKHEGSGIGLSIVKSLVEIHGGTISVESEYGKGAKFTIKLPVKVLECNNIEEKKFVNNILDNYVERIRLEFSDIYN